MCSRRRWTPVALTVGSWRVGVRLTRLETGGDDVERNEAFYQDESDPIEVTPRPFAAGDDVAVTLKRTAVPPTSDQALWVAIRNSTNRSASTTTASSSTR